MSNLFWFAWILFFAQVSFAQTSSASYEAELLRLAKHQNIAEQQHWRRLLYYQSRWYGGVNSIVDSKDFFLASDGHHDATSELNATISAFFRDPQAFKQADDHPICRFPARLFWLSMKLGIDRGRLPQVTCKQYETWRKSRGNYSGVSLVFSSYYPNNPSSMFGHTFLRLHRPISEKKKNLDLLDDAINFAAFPDDSSALIYAVKGLLGQFPGRYGYFHYYAKVQEYNNAEARDLWEYRLNFSKTELKMLLLALWEMGPHYANYFYFDENCSFVLLSLLEVAKPDINLTDQFRSWVIPADTLRAVTQTPNLIKQVSYRPSSLKRFLFRYEDLSRAQKSIVTRIADSRNLDALSKEPPSSQAAILDALIEFIDFQEKIAGTKSAKTYAQLRQSALMSRAKLAAKTPLLSKVPEDERPDHGHATNRLGVGLMTHWPQPVLDLYWRPALHDLASSSRGYPKGLQLEFFTTQGRYHIDDQALYLQRWHLFKVLSLPPLEPIIRTFAWDLAIGTRSIWTCGDDKESRCLNHFVHGGIGQAVGFGPGRQVILFALANAEIGHSKEEGQNIYAGPVASPGLIWRSSFGINTMLTGHFRWQYGQTVAYNPEAHATISYPTSRATEWRLSGEWQRNYLLSGLQFYYYF